MITYKDIKNFRFITFKNYHKVLKVLWNWHNFQKRLINESLTKEEIKEKTEKIAEVKEFLFEYLQNIEEIEKIYKQEDV